MSSPEGIIDITIIDNEERENKRSFGKAVIDFFRAPKEIPVTMDSKTVDKIYPKMRLQIFVSCFIAYVVFYICRKNISAALPAMGIALNYTNTQLGIIGSTLYATYSIGKFTNGILADRANIRTFLPTALLISALSNFAFVISAIFITPGKFTFFGLPSATILIWLLAFFWGCNGWVQSMGFPPIARSFTFWFSNSERGRKWSLWSTSHQLGTFLALVMSGYLIQHYGWKAAFYVPAFIAFFVSIFLFKTLRDNPKTLGLPDVEAYKEPEVAKVAITTEECIEEEKETYGQVFKKHILFNKNLWLLAVSFIFVYFTLMGILDWLIKYFVEAKHNSLEMATMKLSCLPIFGSLGTISAGYISDKVFKSKRAPVNIIYLCGVAVAVIVLKYNTTPIIDFICLGVIGFCSYGPQVLIGGLCAVEASSKKVAAAATGFVGSFGYFGSILSGAGTGFIIDKFGWGGAVNAWAISAIVCIILLTPLLIDECKRDKTLCP